MRCSLVRATQLERATQKRTAARASAVPAPLEDWLQRTVEIFSSIDVPPPRTTVPPPANTRKSLRERSKKSDAKHVLTSGSNSNVTSAESSAAEDELSFAEIPHADIATPIAAKKLPRVVLKLRPARET